LTFTPLYTSHNILVAKALYQLLCTTNSYCDFTSIVMYGNYVCTSRHF